MAVVVLLLFSVTSWLPLDDLLLSSSFLVALSWLSVTLSTILKSFSVVSCLSRLLLELSCCFSVVTRYFSKLFGGFHHSWSLSMVLLISSEHLLVVSRCFLMTPAVFQVVLDCFLPDLLFRTLSRPDLVLRGLYFVIPVVSWCFQPPTPPVLASLTIFWPVQALLCRFIPILAGSGRFFTSAYSCRPVHPGTRLIHVDSDRYMAGFSSVQLLLGWICYLFGVFVSSRL